MDRLGDISLFLRVLDMGSISAAARSLELSVAVASARLKRLEKQLGVRLLHRTTRRLRPTAEGASLANHGRALVEDLEALTASLRQTAHRVSGTLRVATSSTFGRLHISPVLPGFLARYPNLKVNVDLDDQLLDLVGAGFDLAIRIGELDDSSLVARRLASNRRVLCASPEYLRHYGQPRKPSDLEGHECLVLGGRGARRDAWRLAHPKAGETVVRVRGRLETNQGELLRDAAVAGLGIALHSTWHVWEDLQAGRLKVVLPDYTVPDTGIYAITPQRRLVPPRVTAFIEYLAECFGAEPPWERGVPIRPPGAW